MMRSGVFPIVTSAGWVLAVGTAEANFRFSREGYVTELATTPVSYELAADPYADAAIVFTDPDGLFDSAVPGPRRLHLEVANTRETDDVAVCVLVGTDPLEALSPSGSPLGRPAFSAGTDNGLYPSVEEPLPRELYGYGVGAPDSDGDGIPDSEDDFPSDPDETTDTDGDGIGNNADADDDGDVMPDSYESEHGLNPLVDDAADDLDGDSWSNFDEFVTGSGPNDSSSFFRLETEAGPEPAQPLSIRFHARAGRVYQLMGSADLTSGFDPASDPVTPAADGPVVLTPSPPQSPYFYLIRIELPEP